MAKSKKRIKILAANLVGKYGLSYSIHDVTEMEGKQADELIQAGDAREFSIETEKKEAAEAAKKGEIDRTSELKKLKREQLNDIADELGLKHEDYNTIDDIIPAIVEAEEKED